MQTDKKVNLPLTAKSGGLAFSAMILIYLLLTFIGQTVFQSLGITSGLALFAVSSIYSINAIILVLLFSRIMFKRSFAQLTGGSRFSPKYALYAIVIAAGMFFGLGFINTLFSNALESVGVKLSSIQLPLDNLGQFVLVTFNLCVLPAVFEEFFFRGFMLNSLDGVRIFQTTLFVSICFSIYHCSLAQLLYQFIYGGFLCLLALSAKSTYPCIIAHFLNNFAVVLFTYLGVEINLFSPIAIACGVLALAVMAVVIIKELKIRPKREQDKEERNGEKVDFWLPAALFGTVMCLVVMISNVVLAV